MPLVLDGTNGVSGVDGTASNPAIEGTDSNTGIFYPAADTVAIGTNGTEALRVNSSQNVGIGASSPASGYRLHVAGDVRITNSGSETGALQISNESLQGLIQTRYSQPLLFGTNATERMRIDSSGNVGIGTSSPAAKVEINGSGELLRFDGTSNQSRSMYFRNVGSGTAKILTDGTLALETNVVSPITFATNSAERARITSGGEFLIGATTTVNSALFYVNGSVNDRFVRFRNTNGNPYGVVVTYSGGSSPNGTSNEFLFCEDNTALRAAIRSNGGIANYTANNSPLSDRRLKTEIQPAGSYLEKICAIPVVTYLYKDQTDDLLNLGVIAQDVQTAAPELCNEEGWGTKAEDGTNYLGIWETDLHYAVMKAVQELKAIVDTQAIRIETLEAEVQALKGNA